MGPGGFTSAARATRLPEPRRRYEAFVGGSGAEFAGRWRRPSRGHRPAVGHDRARQDNDPRSIRRVRPRAKSPSGRSTGTSVLDPRPSRRRKRAPDPYAGAIDGGGDPATSTCSSSFRASSARCT
jgi:hypothetical protein